MCNPIRGRCICVLSTPVVALATFVYHRLSKLYPVRSIACYARHISLRFHAFQTATLIRCAYHILTDKFCYIGAKHLIIRYVQRIKSLVEFSFYFLIQSDRTKMPHFCAFHFKFLIQL